jgi:hypothetical protein
MRNKWMKKKLDEAWKHVEAATKIFSEVDSKLEEKLKLSVYDNNACGFSGVVSCLEEIDEVVSDNFEFISNIDDNWIPCSVDYIKLRLRFDFGMKHNEVSRWLKTPILALDNRTPQAVLNSKDSFMVYNLLEEMESGVTF